MWTCMKKPIPVVFKKEPLRLVLDGHICTGKTAWLDCLTNGYHKKGSTPHTKVYEKREHVAVVNGERYKTVIYDTNGEKSKILSNFANICKHADVIIEFFSIGHPPSLQNVIENRIPLIKSHFPDKPILLVGTMSDVKNAPNPQKSYFPSAFGPFLAKHVGAFKYVECSALKRFNVHKVTEEAIWALSTASSRMRHEQDIHRDVNTMVMDKVSPKSKWLEMINYFRDEPMSVGLQRDLEMLDREFTRIQPVHKDDPSFNTLYFNRNLELERILISYSRDWRFLSKQPICALWHTPETMKGKAYLHCYQSPFDQKEINTLIDEGKGSPINVFVAEQECSQVIDLLVKTTRNIRSLVIVGCDETFDFSFLSQLHCLEYLVIKDTYVLIETLTFPYSFRDTMKHFVLNGCKISEPTEVPSVIGKLKKLELLNIAGNDFQSLPFALGCLRNVHSLMIDEKKIISLETKELEKSPQDILTSLAPKPEDFIENKKAKLVFVGENKVGKASLIRALENTTAVKAGKKPRISILCLDGGVKCTVYDLPGDVAHLNTYPLIRSAYSLSVVVFNLSQVTLSTNVRAEDNLCRLGLWLEGIASDPKDQTSYVIIVGTHADASSVCEDILQINRMFLRKLFSAYGPNHGQTNTCKECILCQPNLAPDYLKPTSNDEALPKNTSKKAIPHILGYHEVSVEEKTTTGVKELKSRLIQCVEYLMKESKSERILKSWLSLRTTLEFLPESSVPEKEPVMPLSRINELATEKEIYDEEEVKVMLRFFHCQGTYLWYEDLPEMRDTVILDPQWLSDQLGTLISYRPPVSSTRGVLQLSQLPTVWGQMSENNRRNLLALFRSVGLCFSISNTEELFPSKLPVGWPDRCLWPRLPEKKENQTSLLFEFSFLHPSFFPELIAEINQREVLVKSVKPLYNRFHIIYIRKDQVQNKSLDVVHRIHYELAPHNNSLTVAVRGPDPPSIIPDIRSTIETVRRRRYQGITYTEKMLCPKCVMERVPHPDSFGYDNLHDSFCSKGHKVGSMNKVFKGKCSLPENFNPREVLGQTLEDFKCPKHFLILPRNFQKRLTFIERISSKLKDGFTLHLLCECPDQWHFVDFPGYEVAKATDFLKKHGELLLSSLRVFQTICLLIGAVPFPILRAVAALGFAAGSLKEYIESIKDRIHDNYPHLKHENDLKDLEPPSGLQLSELVRFLEIEVKARNFGPLVCTYVDKCDEWLWLCEEHNERFEID